MSTSNQLPDSLGTDRMSIAVISPNDERRNAAISALDNFPNGRISEFMSYPSDVDAVAQMLKQRFAVAVIDLDSDPEYALQLIEQICTDGSTNVIVYSSVADPGMMVRCMRAGSREFLRLPITTTAMTEALVRAGARRMGTPRKEIAESSLPDQTTGKLLVFLSAKGGAGVTTLASSFAVCLAEQSRQRTLLIDLNLPIGDAALNLGIKSPYSTANALNNAQRLDSLFLSSLLVQHVSGLFVLAAPSEMVPMQPVDDAIDTLLKVAVHDFEYVVIDAGSRADLKHSFRFDGSATLYLVTQLGIPELRNANRLIKRLPELGGPKLEIVINRFDSGSEGIDEELVTKALTQPVRWKIPNDYTAARRMQTSATPLTQEDSEIAKAIRAMTESVCGQSAAIPKKKKGFGFF
ncbi:MAG TPA: AAA family ATPase [Terracidiphilus sp.]|nr:AAA family ATPase [Terracidiphilus sp.]